MNKFNAPLVKPNINKQISSDNEVPSFDFKHNKVNNFSVDDLDNENRIALLNTLYKYKDIT
jgi:hypothetical protein